MSRLCDLTSSISGCPSRAQRRSTALTSPAYFAARRSGLDQPNRQIDGGVVGHVHPENLRSADQQRALRARRVGRDAAIEQARQHMTKRAEPPQDRRHQAPHQGAVAIGKRLQPGMSAAAVKLVVEGTVLVQDAVENVRRDSPCRETGHFGRYCES